MQSILRRGGAAKVAWPTKLQPSQSDYDCPKAEVGIQDRLDMNGAEA